MRRFFADIYYGNMFELLETTVTKVWGPLWLGPLEVLTLRFVHTEPVFLCVCELVAQSCLTLYHPMDCSPLSGSSVHGILQARILELVAFPFSRGSSWPRDWTLVSCIAGRFFTTWATREAHRAASNLLLIVTGQVFLHQHWFPRWLLLITFCPRKS